MLTYGIPVGILQKQTELIEIIDSRIRPILARPIMLAAKTITFACGKKQIPFVKN